MKQVAMESTGVYWIPVWNILEPTRWGFELVRIAEFLQYGLLRGSFVPPRPIRQLRDLARMRVQVQRDRNRVINRIGRLLETANTKLGSVVSNIVGVSGRVILKAIVAGRTQPEDLAELAVGSLKGKRVELTLALHGRFGDHFRWLHHLRFLEREPMLTGILKVWRLPPVGQAVPLQRKLASIRREHAENVARPTAKERRLGTVRLHACYSGRVRR